MIDTEKLTKEDLIDIARLQVEQGKITMAEFTVLLRHETLDEMKAYLKTILVVK